MIEVNSLTEDAVFGEKVTTKVILETSFSKEIRILLKKGQLMQEHKTNFPIIIHLVKGRIDFGVNNKKHILKKDDIITLSPNVMHDLFAIEDSIVRLTLSKNDSEKRVEKIIDSENENN